MAHFTIPELPSILPVGGKLSDIQLGYVLDAIRSIIRNVNGRLTFGHDIANSDPAGNIDGQHKTFTFTGANTDYTVPHTLGRIPAGIIVLDVDTDGAVVRVASKAHGHVIVRCNVAGTVGKFVIV